MSWKDEGDTGRVAYFDKNSEGHTHQVGEKEDNTLELFDMSGNVAEWCYDWYHGDSTKSDAEYTKGDVIIDPKGALYEKGVEHKIVKGGAYIGKRRHCTVGYRFTSTPYYYQRDTGFRLVQTVKQ